MIVRELLAVFGLQYDGKGQQKAERGIQTLQKSAHTLSTAFATALQAGMIAAPFALLGKMASDAQEDVNLLQLSFGESYQEIIKWGDAASASLGKSKYTLRQLAAEFGGLLQPMIGTGTKLNKMSTDLTQMAIDLSSARNISETDALRAMQSALSGSVISMQRFGVDLSQTRMKADALSAGLGGNVATMTMGQKASLRYAAIMKDLNFISGDAAKTLDFFANSVRAARDQLKDIGTELGFFLLPAFESLLKSTRSALGPVAELGKGFRDWMKDTELAKGTLITLAVVVGGMLLPVLLSVLPVLLAFAAFALVMDEVIVTLEGGDSILSLFSESLDDLESRGFPGVGKAAASAMWALNRFRDGVGALGFALVALLKALVSGDWTKFSEEIGLVNDEFNSWIAAVKGLGSALKWLGGVLDTIGAKLGTAMGLTSGVMSAIGGDTAPLKNMMRLRQEEWLTELHAQTGGTTGAVAPSPKIAPSVATRTIGTQGRGPLGSVVFGDKTYTMEIRQNSGEDSEEFAKRVTELISSANEEADAALYYELVQQGAQ